MQSALEYCYGIDVCAPPKIHLVKPWSPERWHLEMEVDMRKR